PRLLCTLSLHDALPISLFPDALEELVVASAETSDSPATACKQDWLRFDPSCLSRRGMPWGATSPDSSAIAGPSAAEDVPAPPLRSEEHTSELQSLTNLV